MALPTPEQITKARLKADQAKARLAALEARLSDASRKLDTRRKIILGGLLLDAAEKDERFGRVVTSLVSRLSRPQDVAAFENWTCPKPEAGSVSESYPQHISALDDAKA